MITAEVWQGGQKGFLALLAITVSTAKKGSTSNNPSSPPLPWILSYLHKISSTWPDFGFDMPMHDLVFSKEKKLPEQTAAPSLQTKVYFLVVTTPTKGCITSLQLSPRIGFNYRRHEIIGISTLERLREGENRCRVEDIALYKDKEGKWNKMINSFYSTFAQRESRLASPKSGENATNLNYISIP